MKTTKNQSKHNTKKMIGIAVITLLIANVLLFAFRVYNSTVFWIVLILGAIVAYILPKINQHK